MDTNNYSELRLRKKIDDFYKSLISNDLSEVWEFYAESVKKNLDNDKRSFVESKEENFIAYNYKVDVFIHDIKIVKNHAFIDIKTSIVEKKGDTVDDGISFDLWVFENGDWYIMDFGKESPFNIHYPKMKKRLLENIKGMEEMINDTKDDKDMLLILQKEKAEEKIKKIDEVLKIIDEMIKND